MSARAARSYELAQGLFIALAAVSGGIAIILGDITIRQSTFAGVMIILAGVCWAIAALLASRKTQRRS